jgi:hypothetical protein
MRKHAITIEVRNGRTGLIGGAIVEVDEVAAESAHEGSRDVLATIARLLRETRDNPKIGERILE